MKKWNVLIIITLIILLISNIYFYQKLHLAKELNVQKDGWLRYMIVLKLDRQCDIFYGYSKYLNEIKNKAMNKNEFIMYIQGIKEFTREDMYKGSYNTLMDDNQELKKVLLEISKVNNIKPEVIKQMSNEDIEKLIIIFENLYELLNRNNESNSLTYYILKNDLNSIKLQNVIKKINTEIHELNNIIKLES